MTLELDLRQVVHALADALDLVGVDDFHHGKRVALMAVEVGRLLGLDDATLDTLLDAGMLHDCGVSSTEVHHSLVTELDWRDSSIHCKLGAELLESFPPLAHLAPIILYHHTHWRDLGALGVDMFTARMANLIFLVDRVDALAAPYYADQSQLLYRDEICATVNGYSGDLFSPELVAAFLAMARHESFWLMLEARHVERHLEALVRESPVPRRLELDRLRGLALMFARIVDAKSRFTVEHSQGVSRLARYLGEELDLPGETCDKLEIAGLLHDLGKLRVPDEILDKPGPLDEAERIAMVRHSFESYQILRRIPGLEDIAQWAAWHHESPDGGGYPFHKQAGELPLEARVVAVADVFQALVQNRPYRHSLPEGEVLNILRGQAAAGHLDGRLVELAAERVDECWRRAIV